LFKNFISKGVSFLSKEEKKTGVGNNECIIGSFTRIILY
jgi:hypothetical protein